MDKINETIEYIKKIATAFGADDSESRKDYKFRKNVGEHFSTQEEDEGAYYFGFIEPEQTDRGPYGGLSLVIFPDKREGPWLVCLGVGTLGFDKDIELASRPGVRRLFKSITSKKDGFIKPDFSDIVTPFPREFQNKIPNLKSAIKKYEQFLPACEIIHDPLNDEGQKKLAAYLAAYADIRNWPTNNSQRENTRKAISHVKREKKSDEKAEILELIKHRRYVVLQGAPGTGKTRMAHEIAKTIGEKVFFIQFHAETDYSDFIRGIRPATEQDGLKYEEKNGMLTKALVYARENPGKKTILIIDEINRANLPNVLGEAFYLFEHKPHETKNSIEYSDNFIESKMPDNLFVIATMNTADRSLAIVDFALRRRFAWYTLKPKTIDDKRFEIGRTDFERISKIFEAYADDNELNLQPGQGYFMADNEQEMKNRIKFELMPLIKEYLLEGRLTKAKEEFSHYFAERIEEDLFE